MSTDRRLLFLCTGNYYRSRYAEETFNFQAKRDRLCWTAFSRGAAETGSPDNVDLVLYPPGASRQGHHKRGPCKVSNPLLSRRF